MSNEKEFNDNYTVIVPLMQGSFAQRLDDVYEQLNSHLFSESKSGRKMQYVKVFFSDLQNQQQSFVKSRLFREILSHTSLTTIEQSPTDDSQISLLVKTSSTEPDFIFQPMRLTEDEAHGKNSYVQTVMLFERYISSLKERGLDICKHLLRTWIYVRDIDVNYAGVVEARNAVFAHNGLTANTHFVASTGIEGCSDALSTLVAIDFLTYPSAEEKDTQYLHATQNMNSTTEYGVAFERGSRLTHNEGDTIFVSGTASINNKGQVLYMGDTLMQTQRLLHNIAALLADGDARLTDMRYFIVYLRDRADTKIVKNFLNALCPGIPYIIVCAKVCRPTWLVEMEGIARIKRNPY